jgi:choline dehydrogenase-like flavoprotein
MENVVIVGSGVGGATVAQALAGKVASIKVLEKGPYVDKLGSTKIMAHYDEKVKKQSKEGTLVHRGLLAGGSGVLSCANGVRVLEKDLKDFGIELEKPFKAVENELNIQDVPESHIGERTCMVMNAAQAKDYAIKPMPKFIQFDKCVQCGKCVLGCVYGAKKSPLDYIEDARQKGVEFIYNTDVQEVLTKDGHVTGVKAVNAEGEVTYSADTVITAAGGIGTPIILQKSGIKKAGESLFADLYVNTFGVIEGKDMQPEVPMAAHIMDFYESQGFLLSPYMPPVPTIFFIPPFYDGSKRLDQKNGVGIMVKIKDEAKGRVLSDGTIEKPVTSKDREKINAGVDIAKDLLIQLGCEPNTIFSTNVESAHPGGTAGIGRIVDGNLQTEIKGLFVSDASVLPEAPGAPPIVTIMALAKRLASFLVCEREGKN